MAYLENDLVIVSSGALLPEALNPDEFFKTLLDGKTCIHDLRYSEDLTFRPLYSLIYNSDRSAPDSSYSTLGADIPRQRVLKIALKHGLDLKSSLPLHIMAIEAVSQCVGVLSPEALKKTDLIFGAPDALPGGAPARTLKVFDEVLKEKDLQDQRENISRCFDAEVKRIAPGQDGFPPSLLCIVSNLSEKIRQKFGFGGMSFLVDAACASSFAALAMAKMRIDQGLCDYAIVGGADDCLGAGNMMAGFSKLGVLSEVAPLPFDEKTAGIAIGEGAVAFVVTSLRQALKDKLPILGVVKGIGGSSDGKSGGLTEPTQNGQKLCYENTYHGEVPQNIAYIECHGTGTKVGDRVEITSLTEFFKDRKIPIGSAKYNVGHTMIAAGAVSLLKGLGILKNRVIPPSTYFEKFPARIQTNLFLNPKPLPLPVSEEPTNIAISSFGFGGTNFHLWLQEYKPQLAAGAKKYVAAVKNEVVLCGQTEAPMEQVAELFSTTNYHIPPKVWPWIDRAQLISVLLAEKLFRENGIRPQELNLERMHVISGAPQPLALGRELVQRGMYTYVFRLLKKNFPELQDRLDLVYERIIEDAAELNEQSAIGSINSLVAARVSKAFDFHGLNFNVDGDQSAGMKALEMARTLLNESSGAVLVFDALKKLDPAYEYLKTTGMRCYLLATADFARENDFPILATLEPMVKTAG